jgi:hypothetical protein
VATPKIVFSRKVRVETSLTTAKKGIVTARVKSYTTHLQLHLGQIAARELGKLVLDRDGAADVQSDGMGH